MKVEHPIVVSSTEKAYLEVVQQRNIEVEENRLPAFRRFYQRRQLLEPMRTKY